MIVSNQKPDRHSNPFPAERLARPTRNLLIFMALVYMLSVLGAIAARAETPTLLLDGPVPTKALAGKLDYYLDADWSMTPAAMAGPEAGRFQPLAGPTPDFGYIKSVVWLRLRVRNVTTDQAQWVVYFRENFKQIFEVHVIGADGRIETALRQSLDRGFDTRPIDYPELAAPIRIPPGATATILARYWSEGASYLPMQIETPTSFGVIAANRTAKNFVFYGMMGLLIFGAFAGLAIIRQTVFLAYIAYSGAVLLYIVHADGVAFQHIWPDFPRFNSIASIVTGSAFIISGAIYARVFLDTRRLHPWIDRALLTVVGVTVVMDVAAVFVDNQPIKRGLVLVALVAILTFFASGLVAARTRFKEVRFYTLAWAGAVLSSMIMTGRHWLGIDLPQDFQYDSMRVVMVFDAAMMGLAIVDNYNQLRASRQAAMAVGLAQAQQNLELSARLQELERQFSLADELVRSQDDAVKDTFHDLRQPLNALRLRIHTALTDAEDAQAPRAEIEDAFRYLETLVNERLEEGLAPHPIEATPAAEIGLGEILASVAQMFRPDAASKGLELRLAPTSLRATAAPLPLMRVLSNIVANAVKYTDAGAVLIGARRLGDAVRVEVHDTGPGMAAQDFERAQRRAVRLENCGAAGGYGLGLAIARQIADAEGWGLDLDLRRRHGAGVVLTLPRAGAAPAPE